jgi:chromosome segregation ATPase
MHSPRLMLLILALAVTLPVGVAHAQTKGAGAGKIVCWKDKSGKVVGCGDKVPPEYQDNAVDELNKQGVTVKQSEPALTPEQKKTQQAELERKKAEDQLKAEQRRRDKALLDTYTTEKEIDLKRSRDIQLVESNIEVLQTNLKNANVRQADSSARIEQHTKNKQPVPPAVQDEFDRIQSDKAKIENQIARKRKDIAALNQQYDDQKKRFNELKSGGAAGTAPASAGKGPMTSADQRPR